jgi:hypothetical protein|tara:strand:- start:6 stop:302 length:297 start_codon:yes stop_codon:yes gene_type:complete
MAELQSHFDEFRVVLVAQIRELTASQPEIQTTAWYLLKYFRRIHKKVAVSTSAREVENTIRALIRFYVDKIDEGSDLDLRCKNVLHSHRRSLRLERRH